MSSHRFEHIEWPRTQEQPPQWRKNGDKAEVLPLRKFRHCPADRRETAAAMMK